MQPNPLPERSSSNPASTPLPSSGFTWKRYLLPDPYATAPELARERGFSKEFAEWALYGGRLGRSSTAPHTWAFPIKGDGPHGAIGAYLKPRGRRGSYDPAGDPAPRVYHLGALHTAQKICIFESPWDALAYSERTGAHRDDATILIATGHNPASLIHAPIDTRLPIYLFPRNDPAPTRDLRTNQTPAEKWLQEVSRILSAFGQPDPVRPGQPLPPRDPVTIRIVQIPLPHHDLNAWTKLGATRDAIFNAMNAARSTIAGESPDSARASTNQLGHHLLTTEELLSLEIPARRPLLGGWFREADLGIIYAPGGAGKTWFAMLLAAARAENRPLGPWTAGEKSGRILYLDGEMHGADTQARARLLSLEKGELTWFQSQIQFANDGDDASFESGPGPLLQLDLTQPAHQQAITRVCEEQGITELYLDSATSLFGGFRESDGQKWRASVQPWLRELRRRNIAVILIHPATPNGARMRGAPQRSDQADWIIKLTPASPIQPLPSTTSTPPAQSDPNPAAAPQSIIRFITTFEKLRGSPAVSTPLEWALATFGPETPVQIHCREHLEHRDLLESIRQGTTNSAELAQLHGVSKATISRWAKTLELAGHLQTTRGCQGSYTPTQPLPPAEAPPAAPESTLVPQNQAPIETIETMKHSTLQNPLHSIGAPPLTADNPRSINVAPRPTIAPAIPSRKILSS